MGYSIRTTKTASGAQAIQVVSYLHRKVIIHKHLGSAKSESRLDELHAEAVAWIQNSTPQASLFPTSPEPSVLETHYAYQGFRYTYAYQFLHKLCERLQFTTLASSLLVDLVIVRIFEPASKLRSIAHLAHYFGINYTEKTLYRALHQFPKLKNTVETQLVSVAQTEFGFDFSFVLYDVTTLYFETFKSDDLRKPGFSKDNKSQQPQIVVGLMVTPQGFPVSYEVFAGNTFEGKTFLPSILAFKERHKVQILLVHDSGTFLPNYSVVSTPPSRVPMDTRCVLIRTMEHWCAATPKNATQKI
jgi:hypothetical protein